MTTIIRCFAWLLIAIGAIAVLGLLADAIRMMYAQNPRIALMFVGVLMAGLGMLIMPIGGKGR